MARASTHTLLSLDRWAAIMGIAGPHFNQMAGTDIFPAEGSCSKVWWQYAWQNQNQIAREDIARTIRDAEDDIARVINYHPAPRWISKEPHKFPQWYRREFFGNGRNVRGMHKSVIAKYGKFISAGRRNVTLLGTPTVVYSDPDGDGFDELATVTQATSLTDECEINTYFAGEAGAQEWEIRPAKTKEITGGNFVATYDSWLFGDPADWEAFPTTDEPRAIVLDSANFVTTVDVYREFTDFTEASAEFSWEPTPFNTLFGSFCTSCSGTGCVACENTIQEGCIHTRDIDRGVLVPQAATYDSDAGQWNKVAFTKCREPDTVKVWYYAGDLDEKFLREVSCERLSNFFADAIAWMATARLERPPCACNNVHKFFDSLRQDLARVGATEGDPSFLLSEESLGNPFGTRRGEIMAWNRISRLTEDMGEFALA